MNEPAADATDRRIAAALQVDGRASWGAIARALDLPERTVARRGQALFDRGLVRVSTWVDIARVLHARALTLRIRTRRGELWDVAHAIASRPDASSVSILESGDDLACLVLPRDDGAVRDLLFRELAELDGIESVGVATVLRFYRSGHDWRPRLLSDAEVEALDPPTMRCVRPDDVITCEERALIDLLMRDGRMPVAQLARELGVSVATIRRRMASLSNRGLMHARTEVVPALFGLHVEALVWLRVPTAALDALGGELAGSPQVKFVAAVTGTSQLLVNVLVADETALVDFLAGLHLEGAPGIEIAESRLVVTPLLRGSLLIDDAR